jgi:hypothetical protein
MNDELPPIFGKLTPRPAPSELRERVLTAVDEQLSISSGASDTNPTRQRGSEPTRSLISPSLARRVSGWERVAELFVAASLVIGVSWNAWQWRELQGWQAKMFGVPAVSSAVVDLGDAVASVTDADVGRSIVERFGHSTAHTTDEAALAREYQRLIELIREKRPVL